MCHLYMWLSDSRHSHPIAVPTHRPITVRYHMEEEGHVWLTRAAIGRARGCCSFMLSVGVQQQQRALLLERHFTDAASPRQPEIKRCYVSGHSRREASIFMQGLEFSCLPFVYSPFLLSFFPSFFPSFLPPFLSPESLGTCSVLVVVVSYTASLPRSHVTDALPPTLPLSL